MLRFFSLTPQMPSGQSVALPAAVLRRKCRCAVCVDELTGRQLLAPDQVRDDVRPVQMVARGMVFVLLACQGRTRLICEPTCDPAGNYAVQIEWSDNHQSSIYPYSQIVQIATAF